MKKTVSLVLGSGAARGQAHIGVIRAIEEQGYEIVSVSGCSIGAIIGGIYAAGQLGAYQEWSVSLDKIKVLRMLDMSLLHGAYIKGDKYFQLINELVQDPMIESLPIPYTAVAVDILNQKEFWFQRGSLIDAMRASSAIPSIVSPVQLGDRVYVDGGVLNPLPIIPSVAVGADYIIAVDLNGASHEMTTENFVQKSEGLEWWANIKNFFSRNNANDSDDSLSAEKWGRIQTINMMFETMQEAIAQYKLAGYQPDLLISIPNNLAGFYEFWRSQELIDFGYEVTMKALQELPSPDVRHHSFPKSH